jgi:hypothetical protein
VSKQDQAKRIEGILTALRRACTRADEIAWLNNSEIVVISDGKIKQIRPPIPRRAGRGRKGPKPMKLWALLSAVRTKSWIL